MTDTAARRAALTRAVDDLHAEQTRFLAELVKVPSDNPPGDCLPHAERAAELLEAMGFTVERHAVPDDLVKANGMIRATNLVVRKRFGGDGDGGPVIALNAHGDVVAPGDGWTRDPYGAAVENGVMYGRGVAVSKSDFATYAYALKALEQTGAEGLRGTVELHLTYDEEAGGAIGPKWLLDEGISRPDYAVSAGFSYQVVTAHNGCLHLEVTVRGRSAHAAQPDSGVDAMEAATGILSALYAGRARLAERKSAVPGIGSPTLVVGLISGGINTNVVPDKVTLRIDRRMIPEETAEAAQGEIESLIREAAEVFPEVSVDVRRIMLAEPFGPVQGSDRLAVAFAEAATAAFGTAIGTTGIPLYTDARHYAAAGVPTVLYGAGPRTLLDANAHRADEKLVLDDLKRATVAVADALAVLLG
ncbi:Acetylornithine deacetylase [Caenispirillum salinarum AK4]|uniref:Acetylornithine deacetylase n=1 Tax=Caenispirillum salinarum AK4 TaxID=1238182 RepID=K9HKY6_9PROT|nr:M20/M25/M40 family metallo-hydrolase [Caenispirillum salinarum]EKV29226.1 Acetylornithine deacetylase [Caenispirillum salinarum AK4]